VQATHGSRAAANGAGRWQGRARQLLASALFALVGLIFLSAELAFQVSVPSLAWLVLLVIALLPGLVEEQKVEHQPQSASPDIPEPLIRENPQRRQANQAIEIAEPLAVRAGPRPGGSAFMLSSVSHEIRTPINAIVGFSELLRDAEKNAAGQKTREGYANLVLENAHHLQTVVNDVLEANRLESGSIALSEQDCDFCEIIEVVIRAHSAEAEIRGITIIAHVASGVTVHGDSGRLKKAVACLVSNAIKFSPSDGIVNVKMLRGLQGELVLSISDAGAGFKPQDLERAFQPFGHMEAGSDRKHGGMGLGLYISRQIARLHGGELQVASSEGMGTEARFSIPSSRLRFSVETGATRQVA
jgi:signal transduction histidine kinase